MTADKSSTQPEPDPSPDVHIGEGDLIANRYRVTHELGRGGMGIVFSGQDTVLDEDVAIKLLIPALFEDNHALKLLKNEAKAAHKLSHPNIVRLHNFEEHGELRFLTMEYVDGHTLKDHLKQAGRLSVPEVQELANQISEGLDYAHSARILHRDLKPANIMVDTTGRAKIVDFGLARIVHDAAAGASQSCVSGTLIYMSPEHLSKKRLTSKADIYSFGATLYHLLAGRPPFMNVPDILTAEPKPIYGVPEHVNRALAKAMAKDPNERWESASALTRALTDPELTEEQDGDDSRTLLVAETPAKPVQQRSGSKLALGLVCLVAIIASAFFIWSEFKQTWLMETVQTESVNYFLPELIEEPKSATPEVAIKAETTAPKPPETVISEVEPLEDVRSTAKAVSPLSESKIETEGPDKRPDPIQKKPEPVIIPIETMISCENKKTEYAIGDKLAIDFRVGEDCYANIIAKQTDGSVIVLFPNILRPDCKLKTLKVYNMGGTSPPVLTVDGPAGDSALYLVARKSESPIADIDFGEGGIMALPEGTEVEEYTKELRDKAPEDWGQAVVRYKILSD
ncbi:protein kinase [Candidatus Hydrogenedentota bacterium]